MSLTANHSETAFINSWTTSQQIVAGLLKKVLKTLGQEVEINIEVPAERKMGDLAIPCFRLSKALKKAPPLLAKELEGLFKSELATLPESDQKAVIKIEAVGPYVNFFLNSAVAFQTENANILNGKFFAASPTIAATKPKTMIEFSQPNTHKAFHVGHCRNVALGDALVRMNRHVGFEVIAANYPGDDGAHVAKCLWYFKKQGADQTVSQIQSEAQDLGEWLGQFYTAATQVLEDAQAESPEAKKSLQGEISKVQQLLEAKDPEWHALWVNTRQWSLDSFKNIYDWLGVHFDHYFFESEMLEESRATIQAFLDKGIFVRSEGAIGVDLEADKLPFFLLLKTDGTTLYSARDLALAKRKFEDFQIKRSIYVVASEQDLHFRQVFKTLERMGFEQAKDCFHLSYGLVTLPSGKMSSRQGNVILFSELKNLLLGEISKLLSQQNEGAAPVSWGEGQDLQTTARRIAVAAIKYGMIASDPKKQIVFDLPKWVAFTGDTGPYLLYTSVRIKSILRKVSEQTTPKTSEIDPEVFLGEIERSLILRILEFNSVVERGVRENSPAILAASLFETCQDFNTFYGKVSIMQQSDPKRLAAYLLLLKALDVTIAKGCELLGIEMVEKM